MKTAIKYALILVLVSLVTIPAAAATISMECSADAWGYSGYTNENYNGDVNFGAGTDAYGTRMMCEWSTAKEGNGNSKFWTKFDISSIQGTAEDATLNITRKSGNTGAYDAILVYALDDGDAGEDWGEYTITYNNAPGNVLASNELDTDRYTYLGAIDFDTTGTTGDVLTLSNAALLEAINGDTDGQLTLAFIKKMFTQSGGAAFFSREDVTYAGATLEITAVPEPTTMMLLFSACPVLLAKWRKRK